MNEKRINKAEAAPEKNGDAPFITHIETNCILRRPTAAGAVTNGS